MSRVYPYVGRPAGDRPPAGITAWPVDRPGETAGARNGLSYCRMECLRRESGPHPRRVVVLAGCCGLGRDHPCSCGMGQFVSAPGRTTTACARDLARKGVVLPGRPGNLCPRDAHREHRARAYRAHDFHPTAVPLSHVAHYAQAEPGASRLSRSGFVHTVEALEDSLLLC